MKNLKNFSSLIMMITLVLCFTVAFASCGFIDEPADEPAACAHADTDNDHKCNTCGEKISECVNETKDHKCDVCGKTLGVCADTDNDHYCDVCDEEFSECEDVTSPLDHKCDICDTTMGSCVNNLGNDHLCDHCGATMGSCADNDNDHKCDVCKAEKSSCADADGDCKCDVCTENMHDDADDDHLCDDCDTPLSECNDDDEDGNCDLCGEAMGGSTVDDTYVVMDYSSAAYSDYVKSYGADGNLVEGTYASGTTLTMGTTVNGLNTYLQVRNPASSGKTGKTTIEASNTNQEGNCYTFQTNIMVAGATAGYNFAQLKFVNNNGGEALNLFLKLTTVTDVGTGLAIATTGSNSSVTAGTILFDANDELITTEQWCTVRVEFYFPGAVGDTSDADAVAAAKASTYLKLYINDTLVYSDNASWAVGANISHVQIDHISSGKASNVCYDDLYFTVTDKAYTAN